MSEYCTGCCMLLLKFEASVRPARHTSWIFRYSCRVDGQNPTRSAFLIPYALTTLSQHHPAFFQGTARHLLICANTAICISSYLPTVTMKSMTRSLLLTKHLYVIFLDAHERMFHLNIAFDQSFINRSSFRLLMPFAFNEVTQ